ncbi:hypothetical protein F5Y10DRAFT_238388 [Nemania abortiva]|nr:hypothetical protein F5Y10DRAFT_238388 [Nemania abortiva]
MVCIVAFGCLIGASGAVGLCFVCSSVSLFCWPCGWPCGLPTSYPYLHIPLVRTQSYYYMHMSVVVPIRRRSCWLCYDCNCDCCCCCGCLLVPTSALPCLAYLCRPTYLIYVGGMSCM